MLKEKFSRLLEKQGQSLKLLGIYSAVVLLIFSLSIPLIQQRLAVKKAVAELPVAAENVAPPVVSPLDSVIDKPSVPQAESILDNPEKKPEQKPEEKPREKPAVKPEVKPDTAAKQALQENRQETGKQDAQAADITKIAWPLKGKIIREAGLSYSQTFSDYRFHNGIDIEAARGTQVNNTLPGKVISSETTKGEAKKITVDHGGGWVSIYAQLEEVYVKPGEILKAGQAIGHIGQPGINEVLEGPHLHYSLQKDGQIVNPLDYLPQ